MPHNVQPTGKRRSSFADQVDELVHCKLNNKPPGNKQKRYGSREQKLANALTLLYRLLERHQRELLADFPHHLNKSGLLSARRILDELKSGHGDLIWDYIEDVRSKRRPHNRPPANAGMKVLQATLVGIVRAYGEIASITSKRQVRAMQPRSPWCD
jgi:hypothetical protein